MYICGMVCLIPLWFGHLALMLLCYSYDIYKDVAAMKFPHIWWSCGDHGQAD